VHETCGKRPWGISFLLAYLQARVSLRNFGSMLSRMFFGDVCFALWVRCLCCVCLSANVGRAQVSLDSVLIDAIVVLGNKHTQRDVVLRELDIEVGQRVAVAELDAVLARNEDRLMNTNLFVQVSIRVHAWEGVTGRVGLTVRLREAWYTYPVPIFELADRNFNVWWDDYNRSLDRINYGLKLYHFNLLGRNDEAKLTLQYGYTQKLEWRYTLPSLGKGIDWGLRFNVLAARNKEIAWASVGDRQQFYRDEDQFLLWRLRSIVGLRRRYGNDLYTELSVGYFRRRVHPFVIDSLNPAFLSRGPLERYLRVAFEAVIDKRDVRPFPLHGYYLSVRVYKEGIGLFAERRNRLLLSLMGEHYSVWAPRWSVVWRWKLQTDLVGGVKPFYGYRALGYGEDYLRGYEYYVIDGKDYAYLQSTLRWVVFDRTINWGQLMLFDPFRLMPLRVYVSVYSDVGYVHDPWFSEGNLLRDRLLWGYGVGLNFLAYYNKLVKLEWSHNMLGEHNVYLHWKFRF